jgi:hypothetical protein
MAARQMEARKQGKTGWGIAHSLGFRNLPKSKKAIEVSLHGLLI